ncbi:VC0807 family protein [Nonomuraea sp. NPDC059194]|uniref:VC0807 family protein n=1 Tax=Nonomuraea sp. NPDC059194 TaxID=3346764 RepID=UPI003693A0F9
MALLTAPPTPPTPPAVVMPRLSSILRHAVPRVLEAMVMPVATFYAGMIVAGIPGGLAAAVAWVYGGAAWRLWRRTEVPGSVLLAAVMITVRVVLAVVFDDPKWFFLIPTMGVFCASATFLCTVGTRRPMAQRVAADLVPLPEHVERHPLMRRFFVRQSLVWGCAQLVNGAFTLWMLLHETLSTFLLVRTAGVAVLLGGTALASILDFRRTLGALQFRA